MILKKKDSCKFLQLFAELARNVYSDTSFNEPTIQRVTSTCFCFLFPVITGLLIHFTIALLGCLRPFVRHGCRMIVSVIWCRLLHYDDTDIIPLSDTYNRSTTNEYIMYYNNERTKLRIEIEPGHKPIFSNIKSIINPSNFL